MRRSDNSRSERVQVLLTREESDRFDEALARTGGTRSTKGRQIIVAWTRVALRAPGLVRGEACAACAAPDAIYWHDISKVFVCKTCAAKANLPGHADQDGPRPDKNDMLTEAAIKFIDEGSSAIDSDGAVDVIEKAERLAAAVKDSERGIATQAEKIASAVAHSAEKIAASIKDAEARVAVLAEQFDAVVSSVTRSGVRERSPVPVVTIPLVDGSPKSVRERLR